jgi:predicted PurR-regulated permease PerM
MFGNLNKFAKEKFNEPDLVGNLLETLKAGAGAFVSTVVNGAANTFIQIIVMYFTLFFTIKNFREFEKRTHTIFTFSQSKFCAHW